MKMVYKLCDWLRSHINKKVINKLSIVVILLYYYLGLLSYITVPIKPLYRLFTSSSSVALIIRAVMTALICLYSLLVIIANKKKIQWKWLIIFIYILLFTLVSTALSPQTYNYIYVSNGNYQVVYWVQASASFRRLFTMYLSSLSDFALAFCFLFVLPFVINNKKQLLILLLPIVTIGIFECIYSLAVEKQEYIKLINFIDPQYGGYNINIGASFGNKQDWGAFATISFISAITSFFLVEPSNWKKVLFKVLLILFALVLFVFSVASLCKTAILSQIFFAVIMMIYLAYFLFKRNKIIFVIFISFASFVVLGVIAFYAVPSLHSGGILEKIYNVTYNFIFGRLNGETIFGRTSIWLRLVENMRTYNLFFGLSKGGISTYSQVVTVEGQSAIHNGFAYFFGSYGVFGLFIYLILLALVIMRIFKLLKKNVLLFFTSIASLVVALVFSLVESEVLIVSGSNPIFIFNILVCVFPMGYLGKANCKKENVVTNVKEK